MKKLLAIGEKEYIRGLKIGSNIEFKVKPNNTIHKGIVSGVSDNLEVQINNSNAPTGCQDIEIVVSGEVLYAR